MRYDYIFLDDCTCGQKNHSLRIARNNKLWGVQCMSCGNGTDYKYKFMVDALVEWNKLIRNVDE